MSTPLVTFVLSGFKRPHVMREQYDAIQAQTVKDFKVMYWVNAPGDSIDTFADCKDILEKNDTVVANNDYGSWGRFVCALNTRTQFIHVVDDDTIPGPRWLENCIETYNEVGGGVLSTRGVIMTDKDMDYPAPHSYKPVGWCAANEETTRVDMGCHSWFFDKNVLRAYFAAMPTFFPQRFGEDTHIAWAAKHHMNLNSYVPKHPKNDTSLWGSDFNKAVKYGEEACAISMDPHANAGMRQYWQFVKSQGYKTMVEENK